MEIRIKNSLVGKVSALSGVASLVSVHSVFHILVMSSLSLLAVSGIVVNQMPPMFLMQYHTYFWGMAIFASTVCLALYLHNKNCMRKEMVVANAGFVIIGIPFLEQFSGVFLVIGSGIVLIAVLSYLNGRFLVRNKTENGSASACCEKCEECKEIEHD
jgi:hypothetical protein